MKRNILSYAVLFCCSILMLTSCKKYELSEQFNADKFPKTTISGFAKATVSGIGDVAVPSGTELEFKIPFGNYDRTSSAEGYHTVKAVVGNSGKYSVDIPVPSSGVTVFVASSGYDYEYVKGAGRTHYVFAPTSFSLSQSNNIVMDFRFVEGASVGEEIIPNKNVEYSGTAKYVNKYTRKYSLNSSGFYTHNGQTYSLDSSYGIIDVIPSGTKIDCSIFLYGRNNTIYEPSYKDIQVGVNGAVSLEVPMVDGGYAGIVFSTSFMAEYQYVEIWDDEETVNSYQIRYTFTAEDGIGESYPTGNTAIDNTLLFGN
ncbi:MAG: hypothetical protein LBG17_01560 [Bacteroidales bacterium]|jgi:hypothetical protein|nr:hypothetical protein [Bacteroidales bacterium]